MSISKYASKMSTSVSSVAAALVIVTLLVAAAAADDLSFECATERTKVTGDQGYLSITRNKTTCGFFTTTSFLAIQTDNLVLHEGETLTIQSREDSADKARNITGPINVDFFVLGTKEPQLTFNLIAQDNTTMVLKFYQNQDRVPVDGNRQSELVIQSIEKPQYNLDITKSIADPVHVEVLGSADMFGHQLVDQAKSVVPVVMRNGSNEQVTVRIAPVLKECSGLHEDSSETSYDVVGPSANKLKRYRCVHVFTTKMSGQAHYEADFANFLDIVDKADELMISDVSQTLKITQSTAKYYYQQKPVISFKGQKLVVAYDSPQGISPHLIQFKLTILSKAYGGVVDTYDYKFDLPTKGSVRYSLRPPSTDQHTGALAFNKFSGADVKIYVNQNEAISLPDKTVFPPMIFFGDPYDNVNVEFNVKSKVSGSISYKPSDTCSGTFFKPSGTISVKGANKACYWLLGANSVVNVQSNDLQSNGCFQIHTLDRDAPVFSKCSIGPAEVLPPFIVGPGYLSVTTQNSANSFGATVSPVPESRTFTSTRFQTTVSSVGYPTSYVWSSESEQFSIDASKRSVVVSVSDLDLRAGEKLLVGPTDITPMFTNRTGPVDVDISKQKANITIQRSIDTKDFNHHRGYKIVEAEFQTTLEADMKKNSIKTPSNLQSLLLKIPAEQHNRVSYKITFSNTDPNYDLRVFDSRSISGRLVDESEKLKGSTTSNILLVSLRSTKDKAYLPELTVDYEQIACNETVDHLCDESTRCVPAAKLCKGVGYCMDGTDLQKSCSGGPTPSPKIIENGVSGVTVFILSILMFALGIVAAIFGPDLYKNLENRYRAGTYTTFQSTE